METMDWTRHASNILIDEEGWIDLLQFRVGQVIECVHASEQSWMIIDVRRQWLKVLPLFDCYKNDPRKHERFSRDQTDIAFERGWWRVKEVQ